MKLTFDILQRPLSSCISRAKKRGLSELFLFQVAIEDSIILDVNAVHHILSCTKNLNLLLMI